MQMEFLNTINSCLKWHLFGNAGKTEMLLHKLCGIQFVSCLPKPSEICVSPRGFPVHSWNDECAAWPALLFPQLCSGSKDMQGKHVWKDSSTHDPLRGRKLSEISATGSHRANENKNELNLKDNDSSMSNYLRWIFDDTSSSQLVRQSPKSAFGKEG